MAKISLKQSAYDLIKEKIVNCEYIPGSLVTEESLCQELNMSRTPVRDALGRLEQERLITIYPKRGISIMAITASEIIDVYEGRILLEPYIIRTYCSHLPDTVLSAMRNIMKEELKYSAKPDNNIYDLDRQFHALIVEQCHNNYLLQLHRDLNVQNDRIRILAGRASQERLQVTFDEHAKVFYELTMHHVENAAKAMEEHLTASKENSLVAFMKSNSFL